MQHLSCGLIELKFAQGEAGAKEMKFSGYGAAFGNVDSYGDVIEPGAFAQWLSDVKAGKREWPAMLLQHGGYGMTAEDMMPVGVFTELAEDGKGLRFDGVLADIQRARDAYELMKMKPRPAINGMSIGYIPKEWEMRSKPEEPRRRLKRIDVVEISLVTFPANGNARVDSVKSTPTIRDAERALRDAGYSARQAKAILADGFKSMPSRDDEAVDELAAILRRNVTILQP